MTTVVVDITEELGARAASALLGHPDVERIGVIGRRPPRSWGRRVRHVDTAAGFDVGIGLDGAGVRVHRRSSATGLAWASTAGLARAMATRLGDGADAACTTPGPPLSEGERFPFPPPIGWARGLPSDPGIYGCPVEGTFAGAAARRGTDTLATADDGLFLAAACLAAGAILSGADRAIRCVWHRADEYLAACELFGVVLAAGTA